MNKTVVESGKRLAAFGVVAILCLEAAGGIEWSADGKSATVLADGAQIATAEDTAKLANLETLTLNGRLELNGVTGLDLKANISGSGELASINSTFTISGSNDAHMASMRFTNSFVYVTARHALGLEVNSRRVDTANAPATAGVLRFRGEGRETDAEINVVGNRNSNATAFYDSNTDSLVFNGVLRSSSWLQAWLGTATIRKGLVGNMWYVNSAVDLTFEKTPLARNSTGSYNLCFEIGGPTLRFNVQSNGCEGARFIDSNVICGTTDVFKVTSALQIGMGGKTATFDLNGFDQTLPFVTTYNDAWNATPNLSSLGAVNVTSARPAVLTLNGTGFEGKGEGSRYAKIAFTGEASLHFNGTGTYEISNAVSTSIGSLRVSKGTLRFKNGADWRGLDIAVDGGTLELLDGVALNPDGMSQISLSGSGKLHLGPGVALSVASVSTNGVVLPPGVAYDSSTLPEFITGSGSISSSAGTTAWKTAQNGNWGDAAMWTAGVPSREGGVPNAVLGADGSMTATVAAAAADISSLVLGRYSGASRTTLDVSNPLTVTGGMLQVNNGSRISIPAGSSFTYDGTGRATSSSDDHFDGVFRGACIENAGSLNFTNLTGNVAIKGRLDLKGGYTEMHSTSLNVGRLNLGEGGSVTVSGDAVCHFSPAAPLYMDGGSLIFTNNAALKFESGMPHFFGGGLVRFAGQSRFKVDYTYNVYPRAYMFLNSENAPECKIEVVDDAVIDLSQNMSIYLCPSGSEKYRVSLRFASTGTNNIGVIYVGQGNNLQNGTAEMLVESGVVKLLLGYGCWIGGNGTVYSTVDSRFTGTGIVRVTGGKFAVAGSTDANYMRGILVGDGAVYAGTETRQGTGILEISGDGEVELSKGLISVGTGQNTGRVLMTGGTFTHKGDYHSKRPTLIGWAGGVGDFIVSNGVFSTKQDVYVGGVETNILAWGGANADGQFYGSRHNARGTITVAAADASKPCSFTTTGSLVVGMDGSGSLVLGEAGSLNVGDLVLSNQTASAVSFRLGATGAATITASGALTVAEGAKLHVDASAFTAKSVYLIRANGLNGAFAEEDIELVASSAGGRIVQDSRGVKYVSNRGFLMLLR